MEKGLTVIKGCIAVIGGLIATALGGVDSLLILLVQLIIFDIITGVIKAIHNKKLSSRDMFWGIVKKMMIFVIIVISVRIDTVILEYLKTPIQINGYEVYLRTGFILYFCLEEIISLLENLCDIGVPFPKWLRGILKQVESTASGETTPTVIVEWIKKVLGIDVKDKKESDKKKEEETKSLDIANDNTSE